jgi:ribosomal protein L37AE/L43A
MLVLPEEVESMKCPNCRSETFKVVNVSSNVIRRCKRCKYVNIVRSRTFSKASENAIERSFKHIMDEINEPRKINDTKE